MGEVSWLYTASQGSVDAVGEGLKKIAERAGFYAKTKVHALGEGALWIREQMERIFGCQMKFTVDFFHLCDYLSSALEVLEESKKIEMEKSRLSSKKGRSAWF